MISSLKERGEIYAAEYEARFRYTVGSCGLEAITAKRGMAIMESAG
jgi:hypothetical protein